MEKGSLGIRLGCATLVLAMAPGLAQAYIDPGSGAYMVQALFAVIGAALFYLRHPLRSLRTLASRLFARKGSSPLSGEAGGDLGLSQESQGTHAHKDKEAA